MLLYNNNITMTNYEKIDICTNYYKNKICQNERITNRKP